MSDDPFEIKEVVVQVKETTTFSARLISSRKALCLTQGDVADALEMNRTTLTMWELGKSHPNVKNLYALCKLYRVTPNYLLDFD